MQLKWSSPNDYINQIPEDRRQVMMKLRKVIQDNLPKGFEEGMNYNMIGYYIPHSLYPDGYHCNPELPLPFINIASKKNFIAVYHMGMYAKKEILEWFSHEYPKHCKYKLDIGKSCIRFKKIHDIPFKLIGQLMNKMTAQEWIEIYESVYKK
ncbi:DUF1801 domain-containing protein [Flavobacteriaceae bacterium]|jgi:hypothetical protein|nr:DUF1801 domain-containing protein [Flavobacteriaceae bacterium]